MAEEPRAKIRRLPSATPEIFCRTCVFYAPHRIAQRCRHPQARQVVKTYEGHTIHYAEPEERNAHYDCPDCTPVTWRLRLASVLLVLGCLVGLWTLLFSLFPWLFGR